MFTDLTKKVEEVISKFSKQEVINIDSDIKLETSYINSLVAMLNSTGSSINSVAKSGGEAFSSAADSIKKGGEVTIKYAADQISQASRTSGQVLSQAVNSAGNSLNKAGQQVSKVATSAGAAVSTGLSTAASAVVTRSKAVLSGLYNSPGAIKEFLEKAEISANSFIDDMQLAPYNMDSDDYKKGRAELKEKEEINGATTQAANNPNLKNNDQVVSPDNQKINTTQTAQKDDQLPSSSKPKKESQGIDVATTQAGNNANSQRNDQVSRIQNAADSINEDDINNIKNMPEYRRSSQSYDPVLNRLDAIERKLDETRYSQQVHDEDRWMSDGMRAGLAIALLLLLFISPGLAIAIGSGVAVSYGLTKHAFKQPNKQPIAPQENDKANNNRGISNYFQRKSVKAPDTPKTQDKDAGKGI